MHLNKLLKYQLLAEARKCIANDLIRTNFYSNCIVKPELIVSGCRAMAQRSITSFFKFTPLISKDKDTAKEETSPGNEDNGKKTSKRPRLQSSGSESELNKSKSSSAASSEKKKKPKRQRIESSGSESESSKSTPSSPEVKSSPKSDIESPPIKTSPKEEKLKIKVEKTDSPKTYASPKSQKGKTKVPKETKKAKQEKVSPKNKKTASQENSPKGVKSPSPSPASKKVKKEVNSSITDLKENVKESGDEISDTKVTPVSEAEYDPSKSKYHPVKDACWARGAPVPYLALARTFEAIEPISARLKIIEILSNYFRSVIVLTPEDLLASVYLCLNQLAPAYHSLELGIAETYLMKAVGACTGRTVSQLRGAVASAGDLGALAQTARASQRTMFPQPALLVRKVFAALKDIAHMTGHASVNKKIAKIQSLYVATRHSEARYLIRSLEGKLRIGLAEQSVLQALALGTAATPPGPGGAELLDASKGLSAEQFKARVDENALTIKTTYCSCPNYDAVIPALLAHGVPALPRLCRLTVGVPLKPMLAHPTKGVHEVFNRLEGSKFTCEWKYDGERAQIHVPSTRAQGPVPGERAQGSVPGERAQGPVPGEHAQGSVPGERAQGPVPGERAQGSVPGERAQGPVPGERAQGSVPGERAQGPVPGEHAQGSVPGERAQGPVPGERAQGSVPGERAQGPVPGEHAQDNVPEKENAEEKPDFENASIFSRNQENNTSKYPDVLRRLPALLKPSVSSCVLDCEAVAYDTVNKQILPFQILSTRKRKDAAEADIKVQVCVFVFDLLLLNGRPLVQEPLATRRDLMREHFNVVEGEWQMATSRDCRDTDEVQQFLEEAVRGSCEGLMVKTLTGDHAKYDIARRSHNWLKLKKDYLEGVGDTIDVVIIGAYRGRGRRRDHYGGFLAACRDPETDTYQSLCKLGTGFSDEDLATLTETLNNHKIPQPRNYYTYDSSHEPDAWFEAACVWEVRCADISLSPAHRAAIGLVDPEKGISLRFPRFVRVRSDKTAEQGTAAQQLAQMYLAQDQVKNTTNKHTYNADDFY